MKTTTWLGFIFLLLAQTAGSQNSDLKTLYQQGKEKCLEQHWDAASELFRQVIEKCPGEPECDDAQFWLGYCFEKKGDNPVEAFNAFGRVHQNYATSPWEDDARMHQIALAEKLISRGSPEYLEFLAGNLSSQFAEIRRQAAIALGKFGDQRALPELTQIPENNEQYALARAIIEWIGAKAQPDSSVTPPVFVTEIPTDPPEKTPMENESTPLIQTQREKQYLEMLRVDDHWSPRELLSFALWHLLPPAEFREYFALAGYDQDEWLRKYWHRKDPTPTTEKNEYQDEIWRRIEFARKNYSKLINFSHTAFQSLQYLSEGKKHAPWDARGELYIKYGEADVDRFYAFQTEEWTYWKADMDFIVRQYMTNIYGNAISAGLLTRKKNLDPNAGFYTVEEPIYRHDYQAKFIKDIKLRVINPGDGPYIEYTVSPAEFEAEKKGKQYDVRFRHQVVVFDADLRSVLTDEQEKTYSFPSKDKMQSDTIGERVKLNLKPGKYEVALRIEDLHSKKLGIWRMDFTLN